VTEDRVPIIARRLTLLYLNFLRELSPVPRSSSFSDVLTALCRLFGVGAIVAIILLSAHNAERITATEKIPFALLVSVVAITVGNLLKEVAILICATAVNGIGLDFHSTHVTLDGATVDELHRPDGTWERYIRGSGTTIHEWRAADGICRRETLG
jgi:hypothetical protein